MAEAKRTKSGEKLPIVRHPLFPAVVAAWFGALFGLGSLILGVGLLEAAVAATRFDAILPAAAPPLGTTARILLALGMAALGGAIGAALARRIAAPAHPQAHERKRGAGAKAVADPFPELARLARAEASGTEDAETAAGDIEVRDEETARPGGRRGLLSSSDGHRRSDFVEHAPLPGDKNILNVSEFELEGFEASYDRERSEQGESDSPTADAEAIGAEVIEAEYEEADSEFETATPATNRSADPDRETPGQFANRLFDAFVKRPPVVAADTPDGEDAEDKVDFGTQFGARPVPDFKVPGYTVPGFSVLDTSNPDFGDPDSDSPNSDATDSDDLAGDGNDEVAEDHGPFASPPNGDASTFGETVASAEEFWSAGDAGEDETAVAPIAPERAFPVQGQAAERIANANLDELSHVELLERLAITLERRRQSARAARAAATQAPAPVVMVAPEPASAADKATELSEQDLPSESLSVPVPVPAPLPIPAALRPVGLEWVDDEDDAVPAYVPPRHIGVTFSTARYTSTNDATDEGAASEPAASDDESPDEESRALEEGYSSLLDLSRPAVPAVRVEEPEPADPGIEPAVVFPGQEASDDAESEVEGVRPFDAPRLAGAAPDSSLAAARQDPAETERALRAALSSLQRMSGAA